MFRSGKISKSINLIKERPFIRFIVMVVMFGFLYYILWLIDMDSFIINDREGSKILEYIVDENKEPILSHNYKRERLEKIIERATLINKKISEASTSENSIDDSLRLLRNHFQESKMLAYKNDSTSRFETYNRQIDSLIHLKDWLF